MSRQANKALGPQIKRTFYPFITQQTVTKIPIAMTDITIEKLKNIFGYSNMNIGVYKTSEEAKISLNVNKILK
jgi:hypothetical protein